ncbi:MAG: universal stress protein [Planctomycetota bacterium]|nr:universal stress protein [Planctomycetota bacterium]
MKRFKNILLLGGTKDNGQFTLRRAAQLAEENAAKLTVLDVVKPVPTSMRLFSGSVDPSKLQEFICDKRRVELNAVCSENISGDVSWDVKVLVGQPAVEIIRAVMRDGYDLVMKSADGGGFLQRSLFGSTGMHLLRKCPCAVWVIRPDQTPEFDRIVAAVDAESGDATQNGLNAQILELASELAETENAELHIVQAWQLWMEQALRGRAHHADEVDAMLKTHEQSAREALQQLLTQHGVSDANATIHLLKGGAGYVIPELVKDIQADLVVMGTVCRTGVPGLLIGNTAERILNGVDASVLALKPDDFVSPVALED